MRERLQTAASHFALQAVIFFLLGLLLPLAFRLHRRAPKPQNVGQTFTVEVVKRGVFGRRADSQRVAANKALGWSGRLLRIARLIGLQVLAVSVFLAATLTISVAVAATLVSALGLSTALDIGLALFGISVGIWVGWSCSQGWAGAARLLIQAAAVGVMLAVSGQWLNSQITQAQPHDFVPLRVTSADKRDLVDAVRQRSEMRDGHRVYHLTTEQLNKLLAWWVTLLSAESQARVELTEDGQQIWGSLRLPTRSGASSEYLNLTATGQCEIVDEQLELNVRCVQMGLIAIPEVVTGPVGRYLAQWINNDPVNQDLLTSISGVMTSRDGVDVYVSNEGIDRGRWARTLQQIGGQPDVAPIVRRHLTALSEIAKNAQRKGPLFGAVVRRAFDMARQRSPGGHPVQENRAAIVALGIALGTLSLDSYVGDVWESDARRYVALIPNRSMLRKRADWSRHFWVSAAVTLMANDRVSDALGLLKEELDAGLGGSGFSFGDLAADRAGTAFASAATQDAESARAIQGWILAEGSDLDELMPEAADLPEEMSDAQMLQRFDAVGGTRYQRMVAEIERRLRKLPWWREAGNGK